MNQDSPNPSQFYTGLVSDLYDPLVSEKASADQYRAFLDLSGQPALEPFCGSGSPLLDLIDLGYDVDGLDASTDMLRLLRRNAEERGLSPNVYHQMIQNMDLPRHYRSIFIAGASMVLLPSDEIAQQALHAIFKNLVPGGSALMPLEIPDEPLLRKSIGHFQEGESANGRRLRCGSVGLEFDEDARSLVHRLRYERELDDGSTEILERDWHQHWWSQDHFRAMLQEAGFGRITCLKPDGQKADLEDSIFVFLAQKPEN